MGALTKVVDRLTGVRTAVRSAVETMRDLAAGMDAERDSKKAEENGHLNLPEAKSQIAPAVPGELRAVGKLALRNIDGLQIARELTGGIVRDPHGVAPDTVAPRSLDSLRRLPVTFDLLCALIPDAVEAAILKLIPDSYESGFPLGERLPRLRAITARLAELEEEHAALVDQAAEVGISIPHWPEERARRLRAERMAEAHAVHERLNAGAIRRAEAQAAAEGRR